MTSPSRFLNCYFFLRHNHNFFVHQFNILVCYLKHCHCITCYHIKSFTNTNEKRAFIFRHINVSSFCSSKSASAYEPCKSVKRFAERFFHS